MGGRVWNNGQRRREDTALLYAIYDYRTPAMDEYGEKNMFPRLLSLSNTAFLF